MVFLKRITATATPAVILLLLELAVTRHAVHYPTMAIILVLALGAVFYVIIGKVTIIDGIFFVLLPVALLGTAMFLVVFFSDALLTQAVVITCALVYTWYIENVFVYFYRPERYQPYSLENIGAYSNLLISFFFFSALFAAHIFLNLPLILLLPIGALFAAMLAAHIMWSAKVPLRRAWLIIGVQTMIIGELLIGILLLPTTFLVAGLLLAIPYYTMMNLHRHAERGTLEPRTIFRYSAIGVATFIITVAVAPWH